MAGLKIIWSEEAVQCFHQISSFYCSQAGNSAYVRKLLQMITGTLRLVSSYPYMYRVASLLIPVFLYADILEFIIVFIQIIF